jgi:transcriptional regulator with XRE-family HTH domain
MTLQKLRIQKGWSQEQLADLSGLSVCTIQRIERGHTNRKLQKRVDNVN